MAILEIILTKKPSKEFPPCALVLGTLQRKHQIMFYVPKTDGYYSAFEQKDITPEFYDRYEHKIIVSKSILDVSRAGDAVRKSVLGTGCDYRRRYDLREWMIEALKNLKDDGLIAEAERRSAHVNLKEYKITEPPEESSIIYPIIALGTLFGTTGALSVLFCIFCL
jgi:hypothetical protein